MTFGPHCIGSTQMETITSAWQLFINKAPAFSDVELQEGASHHNYVGNPF